MGYFERSYRKEVVERTADIKAVNFSPEELETVFEEVVDIELPKEDSETREITGSSFDDVVRDVPITAQVNLQDVLKDSAAVVAGVAIQNLYLKGIVLLLIFAAIALPEKETVTPRQALTFGVAWDLSENGITPVKKSSLIEATMEQSRVIDEVTEMSEQDIEDCIRDLRQMACIDVEDASEETLIWVNERFSVEYEF